MRMFKLADVFIYGEGYSQTNFTYMYVRVIPCVCVRIRRRVCIW